MIIVKKQHVHGSWRSDGTEQATCSLIDMAIVIAIGWSREEKTQAAVVEETLKGPVLRGLARGGKWKWAKPCKGCETRKDHDHCESGYTLER